MGKARKRVLSTLLAVVLALGLMPSFAFADEGNGGSDIVAKIGNTEYSTLKDAVAAVPDGVETTITLLEDVSEGDGIVIEGGKNLVIDFAGHTYTVTQNLAGSSGTKTQCFQLLEGSDVTLRNGAIVANNAEIKMMIQNYSNLTLDDMTLDATTGTNSVGYVSSNNCGKVSVVGNTSITAKETGKALDVSYWPSVYPEGTQVNIDTTGTIVGDIEIGLYGENGQISLPSESILTITNVNLIGSLTTLNSENGSYGTGLTNEEAEQVFAGKITISGGTFSSDVSAYVQPGMKFENGKVVINADAAVAQIGAVGYVTLPNAIAAAQDGDTVTLLKSVECDSRIGVLSDLTLNLNGNTFASSADYAILVNPGKQFVLQNGTLDCSGTAIFGFKGSTITIAKDALLQCVDGILATNNNADEGHATINVYGTINSTDIAVWGQGPRNNITLDGATITANYFAVYQNGSFGGSSYTIENSTIYNGEDAGPAIYISNSKANAENEDQGWQALTVENSTITGSAGIEVKYTNVKVSNSTVAATAAEPTFDQYNNGSTTAGFAIVASDNTMSPTSPKPEGTIEIDGGYFKGLVGLSSLISTADHPGFKEATYTISGGYFTSDPSAYVAEGKAALPSDIAGYAFMVGNEIETDVEPAVGTPSVALGDDIAEADKSVVLASASSVTASGELAAAANEAIGKVTEQQKEDAEAAIEASGSGVIVDDGDSIKIYAQAYLDIKPTAYDSSNKTMTLDITPMYRVVASTATSAGGIELIGDDKNAVVLADSEKELAGINTMTLSITLPYGFVQDVDAPVYVQHKDYEYTATVTQQSGSGNNSYTATFTNPHGFSEFTIGTASKAVATLGNTSYTTLQAALAAAQDGDTITVLRDGLSASMSGDSRSVNLQSGTSQEMRVTINNQLITIPASGMGSYTYTASSAGIGGGGGSAPAAEEYEVTVAPSEHGKVAAEPAKAAEGDTVTLTVTPDEGYELTYLSVLDADKAEVELAQNADGTYSFEMPASEVAVYAVFSCDGGELCPSHGFADVDQSQWYHEAIDWAVANKVLNGFDDTGLMAPDGEVTRAQMAQILWNVEGRPVVDYAIGFGDVTEGDWFYQAVAWAASEGIFKGYDDGSGLFGPGDVLTREQAAAVLMRWTEANGGDVDARADLSAYPDVDGISTWAVESGCVSWAVATGVISGVEQEDGSLLLDPVGTATRAQTAMLMMRLTAE